MHSGLDFDSPSKGLFVEGVLRIQSQKRRAPHGDQFPCAQWSVRVGGCRLLHGGTPRPPPAPLAPPPHQNVASTFRLPLSWRTPAPLVPNLVPQPFWGCHLLLFPLLSLLPSAFLLPYLTSLAQLPAWPGHCPPACLFSPPAPHRPDSAAPRHPLPLALHPDTCVCCRVPFTGRCH